MAEKTQQDLTQGDEHTFFEDADATKKVDEYPKGLKLAATVTGLVLTLFLAALDNTIIATAIPSITAQFGSVDDVGWYGSAFFITTAATQAPWGKAYTFFPLKIVYLVAIAIFELGSLICGVAPNSSTLIGGRAVTGVGAAGIFAGSFTIVAFSVEPPKRPQFVGILGATYGVASVIGPLIGGAFTTNVTWRWCFYVNLPIGALSTAIILFIFHTPKTFRRTKTSGWLETLLQMDLPGTILIMGAVICYLIAMQWAGLTHAWSSSVIIGLLVGCGILMVAFAVCEYVQGSRALLLGRIMKLRTIYIGFPFAFFIGSAFFTTLYYLPIYFQTIQGVSARESGIRNLPFILAVTLFVIISGQVITKTGYYIPFMTLGAAFIAAGTGLIYTLGLGSPSSHWIGYQIFAGIGVGSAYEVATMVAQATVPEADVPLATAIMLFAQTLGGAFGVSGGQAAFTNTILHKLGQTAPDVDATKVIAVGATELRKSFSAEQLPGILQAYADGIKVPFILSTALAATGFVISFGAKWTSSKPKPVGVSAV